MAFGKKTPAGEVTKTAKKGENAIKNGGAVSGRAAAAGAKSMNKRGGGERVNQIDRD